MKTYIFSIAIAAMLPLAVATGKDTAKSADETFVRNAAQGGMAEVQLGQLAEKNAQRQDVKDFGSRMVKDHGKANDNLKSVASSLNLNVPQKLNPKHQAKVDKLSALSGAAFDSAYINDMVEDHEKDIAQFEKARSKVTNDSVKKFIDDTVPVMKEHLRLIKQIRDKK